MRKKLEGNPLGTTRSAECALAQRPPYKDPRTECHQSKGSEA